jgi:hypothetical protein
VTDLRRIRLFGHDGNGYDGVVMALCDDCNDGWEVDTVGEIIDWADKHECDPAEVEKVERHRAERAAEAAERDRLSLERYERQFSPSAIEAKQARAAQYLAQLPPTPGFGADARHDSETR